jgi:hypothetical protein
MAPTNQGVKAAREGLLEEAKGPITEARRMVTSEQEAIRQEPHRHTAGLRELDLRVDESETQIRDWGSGLNTFNHQYENYRTAFIKESIKLKKLGAEKGDVVHLHVVLCKSEAEFATEASSAFEAGAAYSGVDVKGSASLLFKSQFQETSSILFAQVSVSKIKEVLEQGLALDKNASNLMKEAPEEFVRQYGNYFCSGRETGATLNVVMHFLSTDMDTKVALDSSLKASCEGANAGATIKAAIGKHSKNSSLDITIYRVGGAPQPKRTSGGGQSIDADALVGYVLEFENTVTDENSRPIRMFYTDYGSLGDSAFRNAEIEAEKVLDKLVDTLREYRPSLNECNYAIDQRSHIGLGKVDVRTLKKLKSDIESDVEAIQDLLNRTQEFYSLPHPEDLLKNKAIQHLPDYYSQEVKRCQSEGPIVRYGADVYLNLSTKGVSISAIEHGNGQHYGRLGQGPIRLRFERTDKKDDQQLQVNDRFCIKTTDDIGGCNQRMRKIDPSFGDTGLDDSWAYVGWKESGDDLEFKIVKCNASDDPVIHYGEPVWIITTQLKDSAHLEHGGDHRPNYLCIRNIAGTPGPQWIIQRP